MENRKYLPTLNELIDRLSIHQLKEVFIPENKENYAKEIKDMMYDIDLILKENNGKISAKTIRAIVVLAQMNTHIWYNETKGYYDDLHYSLEGNRIIADKILEKINGK